MFVYFISFHGTLCVCECRIVCIRFVYTFIFRNELKTEEKKLNFLPTTMKIVIHKGAAFELFVRIFDELLWDIL